MGWERRAGLRAWGRPLFTLPSRRGGSRQSGWKNQGGNPGGYQASARGVLARGITDVDATGNYKPKNKPMEVKGLWRLAADAEKVNHADTPWSQLLMSYNCSTPGGIRRAPRPCVWRRPITGAVADAIGKDSRWDWRDCKTERRVRLALQHRDPAPTL